jgi:hypothetical protein
LPLDEEILEGKVALLPEGQPLLLGLLVELLLEVVEETPGLLCLMELGLHRVVVLELRRSLAEVLCVDVELLDLRFQLTPVLPQVFHDF